MNHLSDAEIAELRRLSNEASPGPWEIVEGDNDGSGHYGNPFRFVGISKNDYGWWNSDSTYLGRIDAEFIVASRSAFPRLLDELEFYKKHYEIFVTEYIALAESKKVHFRLVGK